MEPVTERRWRQRGTEADAPSLTRLCRDLGVGPLTARVLHGRGFTDGDSARAFLAAGLRDLPDPTALGGMATAVARLVRAICGGERILVHGDYDVDGITGTALLVENLRSFGAEVLSHIPLRLRDGYGLSAAALKEAAAQGVTVVLSVDCGVSAVTEARIARELGLDLIITDHHQPPDPLPVAHAIVNPQLPGETFPGQQLAGVGVAFFLLVALRQALREMGHFSIRPEPDLRYGLDLVALGTIADLVPLTGINRILVRAGLPLLEQNRRPGVRDLREVAGVRRVTAGSVGFQLAPRLNAAGRLEDAGRGVDLLLDREGRETKALASQLDRFNQERRRLEEETLQQAIAALESVADQADQSIVLADERWHPGVIGIVASRLVERYHRPTVLIALEGEQGKGSARSIRGFHLYQALAACREHLEGFGGHEFAAGLSLAGSSLELFRRAFEAQARQRLVAENLIPEVLFDGELLLAELDAAAVEDLERLAPFGMGNAEPAFVLRDISARQVRLLGEEHLRFTAQQDGYSLPCVAWRLAGQRQLLDAPVDLLVHPEFNEWQGRRQLQLRVRDVRPALGTD
ncbi:single-stranded DNA-specific exonuclease RecJ [Desulfuromonas sp. DDH964]|uniref:single-stranded-DNA-specific exonuclease RecJ n=1 Tax=Desulfuromonas sp. DDH964 TaxID=1823759 RepID=UPI00078C8D70|nr:single-stranded-DNA-specific exonuclease RecJ [Desulfuromonas sp. DDH964]AMV72510.1 single-stranded DNA-specific exonuclease RecJ [Desulfuromonas sp. DDH964]